MLTDTLNTGLKNYGIGDKIRRLRLRKSMGLMELSKHTGLSPALLSKLERGLMYPTLPTLLRIALVFSVTLEHFFSPKNKPQLEIVRQKDRLRFPAVQDGGAIPYYFESLDFPVPNRALNSYLAEFTAPGTEPSPLHEHAGVEFLYILSGHLELRTEDEAHELEGGDSVYFDSAIPHGYSRIGTKQTKALVVTLEPRR